MTLNPIETARAAVETIVQHASNAVDTYACNVRDLDEEIEDQLREYTHCKDPDYRTTYRDEIEDLVGRRRTHHDAIFETIEEAEYALREIETIIEQAFEDLEAFGNDGEKIPPEDDFSIPSP